MSEGMPEPVIDGQAEIALMELLQASGVEPQGRVDERILFWHGKHESMEDIYLRRRRAQADTDSV